MSPRRLRAPAVDGELLADPPLDQAPALLRANAARLHAWNADIQGLPALQLRRDARAAALAAAGCTHSEELLGDQTPWIVTGHQPELFHPGVWVKNFAVGSIARDTGGFGLHLIVDNDLPKSAAIRVPSLGDNGRLRLISVPFDRDLPETPYEDWTITDEALFQSFDTRVLEALGGLVTDPILRSFWPRVFLPHRPTPSRPGRRFPFARCEIEQEWGLSLRHAFLSSLCESPPFFRFAGYLLARAARFRDIHNDALAQHRLANHIRSRNHPVPDLAAQDGWIETPFWTWTADNPRRRPLFVRPDGSTLRLRAADQPSFAALDLAPDGDAATAIGQLAALADDRRRIRTRALTTTMFARLFLADLFIHGIGGAKYDELGDVIIAEFFQITPPAFLVLSQTVWPGLDDFPGVERELARINAEIRDLTYNPDRHVPQGADPEFDRLRAGKRAAIHESPQATRVDRAARARAIRAFNEQMQPWVAQRRAACLETAQRLTHEALHNRAARHRDLSFVLHSPQKLQAAFARVGPWHSPGPRRKPQP